MGLIKKALQFLTESISDTCYIWWQELRTIFRDQGILIFFLLVPLGYPLLYAYIYTSETVRKVPVAVVDMNHSELSKEFIRRVGAAPDVNVKSHCSNLGEAKRLIELQQTYGILYIPASFQKDIEKGKQTYVSIFCDMSGMLYYKAILTTATNVSLDLNQLIKIRKLGYSTSRQEEINGKPLLYKDVALFNPSTGFASFLIPAVLILIIQQTLLLGVGLSAGTDRERNSYLNLNNVFRHRNGTFRIVGGKTLAFLTIYAVMVPYVLGLVPRLFHLVQAGAVQTLAAFILPYLLSCIFFAMTCTVAFKHRENCILFFVFTSVPLLFISGVSWPGAAIPGFWKYVSWLFPSTFGINGYIRINTMGATLQDVLFEYRGLWIQTGIYFITACLAYRYNIILSKRRANVN